MVVRELLGETIWSCTPEEAKELWVNHPNDRWRIWTEEEVDEHFLDDADQIAECIRRKKEKPGKL